MRLTTPSLRIWLVALMVLCAAGLPAFAQDVEAAAEAMGDAAESMAAAAGELADAAAGAEAEEEVLPVTDNFTINNVWMMVCTFLVFIMHLGFATLESGLTRAKNTVNILFKNTAIVAIGLLTYAAMGFNLMYPGFAEGSSGFFGFAGFGIDAGGAAGISPSYNPGYTYWTDFLFQGMFAATAATIISGAVAERVKLHSFLIMTTIYVAVIYPWLGSWKWGGGWLAARGFHDFAGSTLVHSVGGWGALVCAILLGPRVGKYVNGKSKAIMGHNLPLATIGCFLLWLGWFGFNGGSVLSADPGATSFVLVTTCLAAASGIIAAMATSWIVQKKPDLSMALNGCLAGLVGITAGADVISPLWAVVVGLIAGVIVVFAVLLIDSTLKIDDPVGAISVHLVCGIWGTVAVGIFASGTVVGDLEDGGYTISLVEQLIGVGAYAVPCIVSAAVLFLAMKVFGGMRVDKEEEVRGLDVGEHGMEAYSGFQIFSNQ